MWQAILASLQLGQQLNQAQNSQSNQVNRYQAALEDSRAQAKKRQEELDNILTKNELLAYSQNVDPFTGSNAAVAKENIRKKKMADEEVYQWLDQTVDELKRQSEARNRNLIFNSLLFGASKLPSSSFSSPSSTVGESTHFTQQPIQANPYVV